MARGRKERGKDKPMLKILAVAFAVLLGMVVLVVVLGYCLPKPHVAARAISLRQKPKDVFALISNFQDAASWRSDVQAVEVLPLAVEHVQFREKGANGTIAFEVVELSPPRRLVTEIADKNLPFGGRWIYEVIPTTNGVRLNITERGEVYNPVFRVVSRFVLGYNRTLDAYLRNVSRKFGESAMPEQGTPAAP
jgi:hypothetical protein